LVIARYFLGEQADLDQLAVAAAEAGRAVGEYVEEHAVEEGLLAEAMDGDKITNALATARLKVAKRERCDPDEVSALEHLVGLYNVEAGAKKAVKEAQAALDLATLRKFGELTEDDVKSLVLEGKWFASVAARIDSEVHSLTLAVVARIGELGQRYAETLDALESELQDLNGQLMTHLAEMGIV
jgi:type I restriction enzyme M protein